VSNVVTADGSNSFLIPSTVTMGEFAGLAFSGAAHASLLDIGARATVDIANWDSNFTGGTIEAFASATLEQVFSSLSSVDLFVRPVFEIDGSVSHAAGLVSTLTFNMNTTLPGDTSPSDNILLRIDGGLPGTTEILSTILVGPDLVVSAGSVLFMSLRLSTQVSGSPNDIPDGDHFGEVEALNTLSLVGFQTFSDPGYSVPVDVDFMSDSGVVFSSVPIPEPGTGLLVGLGLAMLSQFARRDATSLSYTALV